jgi:ABC-type thiamin/hydroxymethylpyrimidine transport system permease subunit
MSPFTVMRWPTTGTVTGYKIAVFGYMAAVTGYKIVLFICVRRISGAYLKS